MCSKTEAFYFFLLIRIFFSVLFFFQIPKRYNWLILHSFVNVSGTFALSCCNTRTFLKTVDHDVLSMRRNQLGQWRVHVRSRSARNSTVVFHFSRVPLETRDWSLGTWKQDHVSAGQTFVTAVKSKLRANGARHASSKTESRSFLIVSFRLQRCLTDRTVISMKRTLAIMIWQRSEK